MDFNNMHWYDYIILVGFLGVLAYFIIPFLGGLFSAGDDESGLTTLGLIIAAPIVIVSLYALYRLISKISGK